MILTYDPAKPTEPYSPVHPEAMIMDDTDPWVEVDGVPVDWSRHRPRLTPSDCDSCQNGVPLAGVLAPMNSPTGIQRCDTCERYDGDLAAAQALAELVGGVVKYIAADGPECVDCGEVEGSRWAQPTCVYER